MDKEQQEKLEQIEAEGRRKIDEAIFGDFPLTSRENLYRIIGLALLGLGFAGCVAVYWFVGPSMWLAIVIPACIVAGLEFGRLGERKRVERFRKLMHDLDRQKPG